MINKNKNKTLLMLSIISIMLVPGGIIPVHAIPGDQLLTINNPTPATSDWFGFAVATTNNDDLLIGAYFDDTGAPDAGSVYLINGTDGSLLLTINNPIPDTSDNFGRSVATTSNGDLLVGADADDTSVTNAGSAYLFDGSNGSLLLTINNPTPATSDQFGFAVATTNTGDLFVSAKLDDTGATDAGSAYLFDGSNGSLLLTINNPAPSVTARFGYSVATTSNDDLLIGAFADDTGAPDAGSAYLFDGQLRGTTSIPLLTINNPMPSLGDLFGISVAATSNDDLLVGAYLDDTGAPDAGSAYLFDGSNGSLLLTINNPTPATSDWFGYSVATTSNDDLLIGAILDDTGAADTGSVYLFEGISNSTQTGTITTGTTTGNVEILTTCGVQFNSGAPINYGAVLPGDASNEQTLTLFNSGNIAGNILVQGSSWVDGTSTTQMNVYDTKYSITSGDYSSKTSLQLTDQTILTLNPQVNTDTFWQLQANLLDPLFSGSLTQTVDFSVTC